MGGIVGISLCPPHISDEAEPNVDSVIRHIDRYMELGGENVVAIGADLDGTDLPSGFGGIEDMYKIADRLFELGYPEELINKIFFENALSFALKNL
jgi:membrane dipeptidase